MMFDKKTIPFIVLLLLGMASLQAQFSSLSTEWSTLAKDAVREGVYILRVDYVLTEVSSGERFGREEQVYFNRIYTPAVSVGGCLWVDAKVIEKPWDGDKAFNRYRNNSAYKPLVSNTAYRAINQAHFQALDSIEWIDSLTVDNQKIIAFHWDTSDEFSFPASELQGTPPKNLAIYIHPTQALSQNDSCAITLDLSWTKVSANRDGKRLDIQKAPVQPSDIIGGVLFVPKIENGSIVFSVLGLINLDTQKNKWTSIRIPHYDELVPIKRRKIMGTGSDLSPILNSEEVKEPPIEIKSKNEKKGGLFRRNKNKNNNSN